MGCRFELEFSGSFGFGLELRIESVLSFGV